MASHARTRGREDERRLSIRTLAVASIASFAAATVTAQFSTVGTPVAAALTPVIVALVSELLHRPTQTIAERLTSDSPAVLPDAAGAAPPGASAEDLLPERAVAEPGSEPNAERADEPGTAAAPPEGDAAPVRVYRSPRRRRRIAVRVVLATAAIAFAVAAVALTVPELIAGQSIGKGDRGTSIFGGESRDGRANDAGERAPTAPTETSEEPTEAEEEKPEERAPGEEPKDEDPTRTAPTETTTTPAPQEQPAP